MAAVVNSATGFGWVVNRAEVLPLGGAHFWACGRGTWRVIREQCNDDRVDFLREEAAQFVEPQRLVDVVRWLRQLVRHVLVHC